MADPRWDGLAARAVAELAASPGPRRGCCVRTEAVVLIQFSGGARGGSGETPRVTCSHPAAAHRLVARLSGMARLPRIEVATSGASVTLGRPERVGLLESLGLRTPGGRLRGLPPPVIHGGFCDQATIWRAALLATAPWTRRRSRISLTCPGPELGLALVGAARQLGTTVTYRAATDPDPADIASHEAGSETSTPADPASASKGPPPSVGSSTAPGWVHVPWPAFVALLEHAGAPATAGVLRAGQPAPSWGPGPSQLGTSNRTRAAAAAARLVSQVRADLAVLEAHREPVPPSLDSVARLRLAHPAATLPELAALAEPPTTKYAVASKLRRLHQLAAGHI